jgi:hypothetical protein
MWLISGALILLAIILLVWGSSKRIVVRDGNYRRAAIRDRLRRPTS